MSSDTDFTAEELKGLAKNFPNYVRHGPDGSISATMTKREFLAHTALYKTMYPTEAPASCPPGVDPVHFARYPRMFSKK